MSGQFIFFYDPGTNDDADRIPIATGDTREEAMANGIPRLLQVAADHGLWGLLHSSGVTVEQPNLTAEEFAGVTKTIEDFFAKAPTP